jgi:hypothetical protein
MILSGGILPESVAGDGEVDQTGLSGKTVVQMKASRHGQDF